MNRRPHDDDGAILLIVLVIVTVVAVATLALLQFGLDQPKSAAAIATHQRVGDALDSGTDAAVEDLRSGGPCGPRTVSDVDGLPDPLTVVVSCTPVTGGFDLTAVAYLVQSDCPVTTTPTSDATSLLTTVQVTGSGPQATATVRSWRLGSTTRCEEAPRG